MDTRSKATSVLYVVLYLAAIIAANLITAKFGASASIVNAFLFIGLDLTSRDKLHEAWHRQGLVWKMTLLISCGSVLSWLLNRNAGTIALASFAAFASASVVDTIIYQLLHERSYLVKVNGSNVFSALVDSLIFPTIAFGGIMPLITLGQFTAKVLGGFVWSIVLKVANTACSGLAITTAKIRQSLLCRLGFHSTVEEYENCHYRCLACKHEWFQNWYTS